MSIIFVAGVIPERQGPLPSIDDLDSADYEDVLLDGEISSTDLMDDFATDGTDE